MSFDHERATRRPARVAEPAQVYLHPDDQDRLARLTARLATSKSDVLRRGLEALEREVFDPSAHPALGLVGLGASAAPVPAHPANLVDAARDHDAVLSDAEVRSWSCGQDDDIGP